MNSKAMTSYNISPKPPQPKYADFSGYGWIIVLCGFLLYLIVDGIAYNLGLINSAWLTEFQQSETATSWIGSIFYSVPLLSAPITAQLIENFGCKMITIVCGFIATFGFIISSFCVSIQQLYVTVGLISGFGVSAAYIVGILSAERWFDKNRTLAIGIVSAGTGFGTFLIAPITQRLLDAFGWRQTMYFLASLNALMSIVGCFINDPQWVIDEMEKHSGKGEFFGTFRERMSSRGKEAQHVRKLSANGSESLNECRISVVDTLRDKEKEKCENERRNDVENVIRGSEGNKITRNLQNIHENVENHQEFSKNCDFNSNNGQNFNQNIQNGDSKLETEQKLDNLQYTNYNLQIHPKLQPSSVNHQEKYMENTQNIQNGDSILQIYPELQITSVNIQDGESKLEEFSVNVQNMLENSPKNLKSIRNSETNLQIYPNSQQKSIEIQNGDSNLQTYQIVQDIHENHNRDIKFIQNGDSNLQINKNIQKIHENNSQNAQNIQNGDSNLQIWHINENQNIHNYESNLQIDQNIQNIHEDSNQNFQNGESNLQICQNVQNIHKNHNQDIQNIQNGDSNLQIYQNIRENRNENTQNIQNVGFNLQCSQNIQKIHKNNKQNIQNADSNLQIFPKLIQSSINIQDGEPNLKVNSNLIQTPDYLQDILQNNDQNFPNDKTSSISSLHLQKPINLEENCYKNLEINEKHKHNLKNDTDSQQIPEDIQENHNENLQNERNDKPNIKDNQISIKTPESNQNIPKNSNKNRQNSLQVNNTIRSHQEPCLSLIIPRFIKDKLKLIKKIFSHFSNRNFSLLAISTFLIYALYNVPMFFIVELLRGYGYTDSECANFVSIIGISLLVGMVTLGYIGDISGNHVKNVNAVCVLVCGLAESLLPSCAVNSTSFAICCIIFGFSFASAYVLIPKIAEMIVGTEEFATAIGLNFFVQGLALLLGIPFASTIYEAIGSWKTAFEICGAILATGSIFAYFTQVKLQDDDFEEEQNA